jgi:hypothetical protein
LERERVVGALSRGTERGSSLGAWLGEGWHTHLHVIITTIIVVIVTRDHHQRMRVEVCVSVPCRGALDNEVPPWLLG